MKYGHVAMITNLDSCIRPNEVTEAFLRVALLSSKPTHPKMDK